MTPPVADERPLVASGRRSSLPDPTVSGLCRNSQVVACREIEDRWKQVVRLHIPLQFLSLYTDASPSRLGAHFLDLTASGVWSEEDSQENINILEMWAVELALAPFLPQLARPSSKERCRERGISLEVDFEDFAVKILAPRHVEVYFN